MRSYRGAVRLDAPAAEPTLSGARLGRQHPPGRTLGNCVRPQRPLNEKRRRPRASEIDFTQIRTRRFRMDPGLLRVTTRHCAKRLARAGACAGACAHAPGQARGRAPARAAHAHAYTPARDAASGGAEDFGRRESVAGPAGCRGTIRACRSRAGPPRTSCCGSTAGRTPVRRRPPRPSGCVRACRGRRRPAPRPCRRPGR